MLSWKIIRNSINRNYISRRLIQPADVEGIFMDFCDNSDSLAVDFSGNLYCGCRNLYHGSGDVGGNRDPGFIHIQKGGFVKDWVKYVLLALICAISAVMAAFFVFSCCAYLCIAALSAVQYGKG